MRRGEPRIDTLERLGGHGGTADRVESLDHENGLSRAREVCRGGQAVVATADDDDVV
jgi:hypothetical protein